MSAFSQNTIDRVVLHLKYNNLVSAQDEVLELAERHYDDLMFPVISDVLDAYEDYELEIEHIDIDLGKLAPADVPYKLESLLKEAIEKHITNIIYQRLDSSYPDMAAAPQPDQESTEPIIDDKQNQWHQSVPGLSQQLNTDRDDNVMRQLLDFLTMEKIPWPNDMESFEPKQWWNEKATKQLSASRHLAVQLYKVCQSDASALYRLITYSNDDVLASIIEQWLNNEEILQDLPQRKLDIIARHNSGDVASKLRISTREEMIRLLVSMLMIGDFTHLEANLDLLDIALLQHDFDGLDYDQIIQDGSKLFLTEAGADTESGRKYPVDSGDHTFTKREISEIISENPQPPVEGLEDNEPSDHDVQDGPKAILAEAGTNHQRRDEKSQGDSNNPSLTNREISEEIVSTSPQPPDGKLDKAPSHDKDVNIRTCDGNGETDDATTHAAINDLLAATAQLRSSMAFNREELSSQRYEVDDAGLVILNPFISNFLGRVGLLDEEGQFLSLDARIHAVHLLRYLTGKQGKHHSHRLNMEKLLCGLSPTFPIPAQYEITSDEEKESEDLFSAVRLYWDSVKETSTAGIQSNFIQRFGILSYEDPYWLVRVEGSALDILMDNLPWQISTLVFPWAKKAIYIDWQINN